MLTTPAPPSTRPPLVWRGSVRLWAAGSVLAVAAVLITTLAGHALATRARLAAELVAAPTLPLPPVIAVLPLGGEIRLIAADAAAGRVVVLVAPNVGACPAGPRCPTASAPGALDVLDGATGDIMARTPLPATNPALSARWLLVDTPTHVALVVGASAVARYSVQSGQLLDGYSLPAGLSDPTGATLDAAGQLVLSGRWGITRLDPAAGRVLATQPAANPQDAKTTGLVYNATSGDGQAIFARVAVTRNGTTLLEEYAATTLHPLAVYRLPESTRLGPVDPAGHLLLVGSDGTVWRFSPSNPTLPSPRLLPAHLTTQPTLWQARALGWNAALGHTYLATASTVSILDATGRPTAALPVSATWDDLDQPLATDAARGLLYLPTTPGTLLIVHDAAHPTRGPLSAQTALLLARAALAHLLPQPTQRPPFVAAETFPLLTGSLRVALWQHSSDLGWLGPFAGTATTQAAPLAGISGAYRVTFALTWQQLFTRHHTWVCAVAADGAVRLVSESGDAVS